MMSATENPVNPASAMPCGVLKPKNVAKKSTSKTAISRNGSMSSGAPSPASMLGSAHSSREPSPEKKVNIFNGQTVHTVPEVFSDISNDSLNVVTNGDGSDRKRPMELLGKDSPTKQARTETDSVPSTRENMPQLSGDQTEENNSREEKQDTVDGAVDMHVPNGSVSSTPEEEVVSMKELNSQEAIPSTDMEIEETSKLLNDDAATDSKTDHNEASHSLANEQSKPDIEVTSDTETGGTKTDPGEDDKTYSVSDTITPVEDEKTVSVSDTFTPNEDEKTVSVSETFTLGDKEKDTIKEMLAAAVSRVGHECLESSSRDCTVIDCDINTDHGDKTEDKPLEDGTDSISAEMPPSEDLKEGEPLIIPQMKDDDCKSELPASEDTSAASEVCKEASPSEKPATSSVDNKSSEPDKSDRMPDIVQDSDAVKETSQGSVDEVSDAKLKKHQEDLILLDGESDDNMDTVDDSILDTLDDSSAENKEADREQSKPVMDSVLVDDDSSKDSSQNVEKLSSSNCKDHVFSITENEGFTDSAGKTADVPTVEKSKGDGSNSDDIYSVVLVSDKAVEENGSSVLSEMVEKNKLAPEGLVVLDSTSDSTALKPDVVLDTCLKRRLSSSDDLTQMKRIKTEDSSSVDRDDLSPPSTSEQHDQCSNSLSKVSSDVSMDVSDKCEVVKEETACSQMASEVKSPSICSQPAKLEEPKAEPKPEKSQKVCSNNVVRISKEALEHVIQRRIDSVLASPNQSQMLSDMQHRIDYLNNQLSKWKTTAKNFQSKISELTALNRHDRRRSKGQCRHVAIQCDEAKFQAAQGQHITATKPGARPQTVSMVPSTTTASASIVAGGPQTLVVPVAGASANGSLTLLSPSNLPPASANLSSAQYRQNFTAISPKKTVREMLDTSRAESATTVATSQASNVVTQQGTQSEAVASGSVKVIDLTEDEENSPARSAAVPVSTVISPNTTLVVKAPGSGSSPGTFLVPVTSCQPILLQSIVNQQLRTPQGATLMYTNARPAGASGQVAVASSGGLVPLTPGQSQIRPGHIIVRQPPPHTATVPASTATQQAAATQKAASAHKVSKPTAIQAKPSLKHPAPLPPQPALKPYELSKYKAMAPKPSLKISRVPQGIVLSWNMVLADTHAEISNYQLFAYQEGTTAPSSSLWKKVGEVKALPLPMACTLTQFQDGNKYHFAVRAVDVHTRIGVFSDPSSIHLEASSTS